MITEYSVEKLEEALATPQPRHVWINGDVVIVYTGEHIPDDAIPEE